MSMLAIVMKNLKVTADFSAAWERPVFLKYGMPLDEKKKLWEVVVKALTEDVFASLKANEVVPAMKVLAEAMFAILDEDFSAMDKYGAGGPGLHYGCNLGVKGSFGKTPRNSAQSEGYNCVRGTLRTMSTV